MVKKILKGALRYIKKPTLALGLAFFTVVCASQINFRVRDIKNNLSDSEIREEFKEEFGFPILGFKEEIEDHPKRISKIADVIHREQMIRPFELDFIRIRSDKFLHKPPLEQIVQSFTGDWGQYYFNRVIIRHDDFGEGIVVHEIKHAKTFDAIHEGDGFLRQYQNISLDDNGKSVYLNPLEMICVYVPSLRFFIADKYDINENLGLGLLSNYARTNILEDIAVIATSAERETDRNIYARRNIYNFSIWLIDVEWKNERIVDRITVLEDHHIISPEFTQYVELETNLPRIFSHYKNYDDDLALQFLGESEQFLKDNPSTIYGSKIHYQRAIVLGEFYPEIYDWGYDYDSILNECMATLTSEYKDPEAYTKTLRYLGDAYQLLGLEEKSSIFIRAGFLYQQRREEGNLNLVTIGVNDFLDENGIDFSQSIKVDPLK
jgi:hypothetical protein